METTPRNRQQMGSEIEMVEIEMVRNR
jgi:hypothetical protein